MKILVLALVCVLALVGGGCGSLDKEFVDRMEAPARLLLPDLRKAYAGEPLSLDEEQRARRIRLLDEWQKSIDEAVKATR